MTGIVGAASKLVFRVRPIPSPLGFASASIVSLLLTAGLSAGGQSPAAPAQFRLTWPRFAKPPAVAGEDHGVVVSAPSVAHDGILIFEDETDLREMLVTYLQQLG